MQKKAAIAQALDASGIAIKIIADKLGLASPTVYKYLHFNLDSKWQEFSDSIKKIHILQDFELTQELYASLQEKMPKAKFKDLVELFKTVRTPAGNSSPSQLSQTNIQFTITDGTKKPEVKPEVIEAKEVKENG